MPKPRALVLDRAPGPAGIPLLGAAPYFWRAPLSTLLSAWRRHGDVVRFPVPATAGDFLLAHPDHVRQVLVDRQHHYRKSRYYRRVEELFGNGLVSSEGELW